ncbi:hypothetical protein BC476_05985 [Vibrio parahaemolyticus]|uniref:hypothetical protein n=1 Tax=Vibrio parahaemolyticus TaxID=670 RepID=UPI00083B6FC1|nr:hypothetical protein [Vibrio parahaemolyticus]ODA49489.1 hypothetical protein BC476_05985 [Vibrio parahaemolyticus]
MNIIEIRNLLIEHYGYNEYLEKYLEIVSSDDDVEYTEAHHILPKSIWPEFKDLKANEWNKVRLSAYNHFMAHYYFSMATNSCWLAVHYMANISKKCSFKNCTSEELHEIACVYESCKSNIKFSESHKAAMSAALKIAMNKPETKSKLSASAKIALNRPETKSKLSVALKGRKFSDEHKSTLREAKRKGAHWQQYDELFQLWIENNQPKYVRFRTIAIKNNFPDANYNKMISQFNRDIESNPVQHQIESNVVELRATTSACKPVNQNTLDFLFAA